MAFTIELSNEGCAALDHAAVSLALDRRTVISNACGLYLMVKKQSLDGVRVAWFNRNRTLVCDIELPPGNDEAEEWPDPEDDNRYIVKFSDATQVPIDRLAGRLGIPRSVVVRNALGLYVWCIGKILDEELFLGIARPDGSLSEVICVPGIDYPNK